MDQNYNWLIHSIDSVTFPKPIPIWRYEGYFEVKYVILVTKTNQEHDKIIKKFNALML